MSEIRSQAKFIWSILKFILLFPLTLIQVSLKKKEAGALFEPIKETWKFFWEAKVTAWLIVINILLFFTVIILAALGVIPETFIERFLINHPNDMFEFHLIPLLGSMFFHAGFGHLFGNMLVLMCFGRIVEKHFGAIKTFIFYMGAGILSSVADSLIRYMMGDLTGAVGASGAISGMASVAMLIAPFTLTFFLLGIPIPIFAVVWIYVASDVMGLLNPVEGDNVGHIAHLAGFLATMIIAFFLSSEDKQKLWKGLLINLGLLVVAGVLWWFVIR